MFAVGSRAAGIDWVFSLKRAKLGENAHVLINPRVFCGACPVLFGARARPSRVPILPNVGQKTRVGPGRQTACCGVRLPICGLKTNATQRLLFKIQNLCYTSYSPPVWNATFPQCGGRRQLGRFASLKMEEGKFIWIRRNPLKSPDSAKEMKG